MKTKLQIQIKKILCLTLPKLKLFDIHTKEEINLHSEKGKVLLIHLFGLDCEHCDEELEWMNSFAQRVPEDLKVWGISVDIGMEEDVKEFVKDKNLTYNILIPSSDESIRLDMLYGGITPQTLIVDREGVVREFIVGFNQNIVKQLEMQLNRALAE
jgi:peroxiredoxin